MTVADVFVSVGLSPCGPVKWQVVPECDKRGVYVVARVGESAGHCPPRELQLRESSGIQIAWDYERKRWLRDEPVLYIGKTDQPIANG
jgi:hypothetical protein